jgi:putative resolvase
VERIILTHRDRLLRFGAPLLFKVCEWQQTKIVILEEAKKQDFQEELVADVIELMTVFVSKIYGKRSHQNRKKAA